MRDRSLAPFTAMSLHHRGHHDPLGQSSSSRVGFDKNLWHEMRPGDVIRLGEIWN